MKRFLTKKTLVILGLMALFVLAIFGFIFQDSSQKSEQSEDLETFVIPTPEFTFTQSNLEGEENSKNFLIVKTEETGKYDIVILGSPFEKYRAEAEKAFLIKLNVSEGEACSLNVVVGTVQFANPDEAGRDFPLSFCE